MRAVNCKGVQVMTIKRRHTRIGAAEFLRAHGYPVAAGTLATKATRGGGPSFKKFGNTALYEEEALLAWAEGRLSAPRRSTSETDAEPATAR